MVEFWCILECESYVTGSLVTVAVYQIWKAYSEVIDCEHTNDEVGALIQILLTDFDKRYIPECMNTGKVKYFHNDRSGTGNCCVEIHQSFFFASLLDPRIAWMLKEMMTDADYDSLKSDGIKEMVAKANT